MADNDVCDWDVGACRQRQPVRAVGMALMTPSWTYRTSTRMASTRIRLIPAAKSASPANTIWKSPMPRRNKPIRRSGLERRRNCITSCDVSCFSLPKFSPAGSTLFHDLEFPNPEDQETMMQEVAGHSILGDDGQSLQFPVQAGSAGQA